MASREGYIDPEDVRAAIRPGETKLVALTHASNVLGTVQAVELIAPMVRAAGALFLLDAAQSAGLVPIDLRELPVDFLAFPGHKALYGPTGTGALYVGPRANPRPLARGGARVATRRARRCRSSFPTCSKAGRPTSWGSPG